MASNLCHIHNELIVHSDHGQTNGATLNSTMIVVRRLGQRTSTLETQLFSCK